MIIDKEKKNTVAFQIIDSRDDEEGIYYALNDPKYSDVERLERFLTTIRNLLITKLQNVQIKEKHYSMILLSPYLINRKLNNHCVYNIKTNH